MLVCNKPTVLGTALSLHFVGIRRWLCFVFFSFFALLVWTLQSQANPSCFLSHLQICGVCIDILRLEDERARPERSIFGFRRGLLDSNNHLIVIFFGLLIL